MDDLKKVLDGLGEDARAVGWHMLRRMVPGEGEMTFGTPSRIDPRARAALDELVKAELVRFDLRPGQGTDGADLLAYTPLIDFGLLRGRRIGRAGFGMTTDSRPGADSVTVSA